MSEQTRAGRSAMSRFRVSRVRCYRFGARNEQEGTTAELHTADNAVGQVSLLPGGDGFLIRVWPPDGTAEYGGTNITAMSAVARVTEDLGIVIESVQTEPRSHGGTLDSMKVECLVRDQL